MGLRTLFKQKAWAHQVLNVNGASVLCTEVPLALHLQGSRIFLLDHLPKAQELGLSLLHTCVYESVVYEKTSTTFSCWRYHMN